MFDEKTYASSIPKMERPFPIPFEKPKGNYLRELEKVREKNSKKFFNGRFGVILVDFSFRLWVENVAAEMMY